MAIPTPDQFQRWIDGVKSDSYFASVGYHQGVMILRVKGPECQYQGVHVVISSQGQSRLAEAAEELKKSKRVELKLNQPRGRSWVGLMTSGMDIGSWLNLRLGIDPSVGEDHLLLDFLSHTVCLSGNQQSMKRLLKTCTNGQMAGNKLNFTLKRAEKAAPVRNPLSIWLWSWPNQLGKR